MKGTNGQQGHIHTQQHDRGARPKGPGHDGWLHATMAPSLFYIAECGDLYTILEPFCALRACSDHMFLFCCTIISSHSN
eukprot:1146781-Pelagomonas_calceolata.AAC.9